MWIWLLCSCRPADRTWSLFWWLQNADLLCSYRSYRKYVTSFDVGRKSIWLLHSSLLREYMILFDVCRKSIWLLHSPSCRKYVISWYLQKVDPIAVFLPHCRLYVISHYIFKMSISLIVFVPSCRPYVISFDVMISAECRSHSGFSPSCRMYVPVISFNTISTMSIWLMRYSPSCRLYVISFDTSTMSIWLLHSPCTGAARKYVISFDVRRMLIWLLTADFSLLQKVCDAVWYLENVNLSRYLIAEFFFCCRLYVMSFDVCWMSIWLPHFPSCRPCVISFYVCTLSI